MKNNTIKHKTELVNRYIRKSIKFNNKELYYDFPISEKEYLTNRLDPFIYALIFPMMEIGGEFYYDGEVSKSVLNNLEMFVKIWNIWRPDLYKPITIHANEIEDDYRPDNQKMISAFSGGLDASYTAYKYKKGLAGRKKYDLETSIMIHGADIPLKEEKQFSIAFSNAKKMTEDLGINLIPIKTNFREIFNCNWEHCFGTFMVSALNFYSKHIATGAASDASIKTYELCWGMNPITDQYLSNKTFTFIPDGYEHTRTQRASFIKDWTVGLENLRVCWRNEDKSKNCGICEKCIRTKLNFFVNGVKNIPSMPIQFNFEELNKLDKLNGVHLELFEEILNYAKEHKSISNIDIKKLETFIIKNKTLYKQKNLNNKHIPKWIGKIICLFIPKSKNRKHFREKYIKGYK